MSASKIPQISGMGPKATPIYGFGEFRLDAENRLLQQGEKNVPLTPKAFDTLLFLVEGRGRLVTKDELMSAMWPDTAVCESNLTQTIFMLRKALGESASAQRYIVTVPGSGYRFGGAVSLVDNESAPAGPLVVPAAERARKRRWLRAGIAAAALALSVIAGVLFYHYAKPLPAQARPGTGRVMLAVLPFQNLTGDASQDYFSDGFTEDTIIETGKLDPTHLGVIAHTSVVNYKDGRKPLPQIGRELGVQYVLQGSIHRDATQVQITAELIEVSDQRRLWSQKYDRGVGDVAGVPRVIGRAVADHLESPDGRARAIDAPAPQVSSSYAAYDLELKARYSLSKRTADALQQAADYFRQAIAADPNSARAYAGLAATYALIASYNVGPPEQLIPLGREAAQQAIRLDPGSSEAHTALALIVQDYDWDWQTAEQEFRHAIELDPNNATAHQWYAEHLAYRGRFDEAFTEIERARRLDPVSLIIACDHATILLYARRYEQAAEQFRSILDVEPTFIHAHMILNVYLAQHRVRDAEADLQRWGQIEKTGWWFLVAEGQVNALSGNRQATEAIVAELKAYDRKHPLDPAAFATLYTAMGQEDQAFAALEKARERHSIAMTSLKVHPTWDALRSDPRFTKLLRSVNLEP